jgi:RNA polymerase sigma factor (sigma-70 family)
MAGISGNSSPSIDENTLGALVEQHAPMIRALCRRMLHDLHEAEDAFQATFLALIRRAGDLTDRDALGPWLFGVARRTALRARSSRIRRDQSHRPVGEDIEDRDLPHCDDPLQKMLDADHLRVLREEVDRLPADYRAPIVLCDVQGLTRQEAAQRLGWPVGTVGSRIARGHALLRTRLTRRGLGPAAHDNDHDRVERMR